MGEVYTVRGSVMNAHLPEEWGLIEALAAHPRLRLIPTRSRGFVLRGTIRCWARSSNGREVDEPFQIEVQVSHRFPREVPSVFEIAGRIPKAFHHLDDGALCLGSPTAQRLALEERPTIGGFLDTVVVPFLYGFVIHSADGTMPFGELAHGAAGLEEDILAFFRLPKGSDPLATLLLAGRRRRDANKRCCPCESPSRLGRCHHIAINEARLRLGRAWFREQAKFLVTQRARDAQ